MLADNAPVGIINTDSDLRNYLLHDTGFNFPNSTISEIMKLYPGTYVTVVGLIHTTVG